MKSGLLIKADDNFETQRKRSRNLTGNWKSISVISSCGSIHIFTVRFAGL
jgi:hypothetical protein